MDSAPPSGSKPIADITLFDLVLDAVRVFQRKILIRRAGFIWKCQLQERRQAKTAVEDREGEEVEDRQGERDHDDVGLQGHNIEVCRIELFRDPIWRLTIRRDDFWKRQRESVGGKGRRLSNAGARP